MRRTRSCRGSGLRQQPGTASLLQTFWKPRRRLRRPLLPSASPLEDIARLTGQEHLPEPEDRRKTLSAEEPAEAAENPPAAAQALQTTVMAAGNWPGSRQQSQPPIHRTCSAGRYRAAERIRNTCQTGGGASPRELRSLAAEPQNFAQDKHCRAGSGSRDSHRSRGHPGHRSAPHTASEA